MRGWLRKRALSRVPVEMEHRCQGRRCSQGRDKTGKLNLVSRGTVGNEFCSISKTGRLLPKKLYRAYESRQELSNEGLERKIRARL